MKYIFSDTVFFLTVDNSREEGTISIVKDLVIFTDNKLKIFRIITFK